MRITGGSHRGRPVAAPPGLEVRPTADRVREALFNRLIHGSGELGEGNLVAGGNVLDAFCGTGALGFEALSHGADRVVALERDAKVARAAERTARALGFADAWSVRVADTLKPPAAPAACDLAFLDPPYGEYIAGAALAALAAAGWIAAGTLCALEHDRRSPPTLPDAAMHLSTRAYGRVAITLVRWQPRALKF